jgi:hypothetical protein
MRGIYVVAPHAQWIIEQKKKALLKKRYYPGMINIPLALVGPEGILGIILLEEPKLITRKEFEKLKALHKVTKEEAMKWWGFPDKLYLYPIKIIERFSEPIPFKPRPGTQTFIRTVVKGG